MANKIEEANTQLKKLNKFDKNTIRLALFILLPSLILVNIPIYLWMKEVTPFYKQLPALNSFFITFILIRIVWRIQLNNEVQDFIKKQVYLEFLAKNFPQISYQSEGQITVEEFQKSCLFSLESFNNFSSYDKFQIQGSNQINGIEIKAVSKSGRDEVSIFTGLFVFATHNNNFEGETYIVPSGITTRSANKQFLKNYLNQIASLGSNFLIDPRITKNEKVILESPVFMKQYDVYTTSQLGARLALTTDIIDSINQLTEQTKLPILFSFIESTVYICVASQDLFKVSNYSIEVESNLKTLNDEINWLIEFTEKLKLHQTKF